MEITLKVTPSELLSQASSMQTSADAINTELEASKSRISETSAYWTGEAGDAMRERYTQLYDDIQRVLDATNERVKDLKQLGGDTYSSAEADVKVIIGTLPTDGVL